VGVGREETAAQAVLVVVRARIAPIICSEFGDQQYIAAEVLEL
jgi:hypothetical protein